jgi:hypothetical protein
LTKNFALCRGYFVQADIFFWWAYILEQTFRAGGYFCAVILCQAGVGAVGRRS